VASGSGQAEGTVGEELADERVSGKTQSDTVVKLLISELNWSTSERADQTYARTIPRRVVSGRRRVKLRGRLTDGNQLWGNLAESTDTLGDGVCCRQG
jgi:hypothetical protein